MKKFQFAAIFISLLSLVVLTACQSVPTETNDNTFDNTETTDDATGDTTTGPLQVFFGNTNENPNTEDCKLVYGVERDGGPTNPSEAAINAMDELLKGPTEEEKTAGYTSFFNAETADDVNSIRILQDENTAYINFKAEMKTEIPNASSSCGSAQLLASIEKTLGQFDITKVYYTFDGNAKEFYSWLQLSCPSEYEACRQ